MGKRPKAVTGSYSPMGEWDVLVGENLHLSVDELMWWEPLDETLVQTNVTWLRVVTSSANLPVLSLLKRIGTMNFHFFGEERKMLARFTSARLSGVMFEQLGRRNPDDFRATGECGPISPPESMAGGTPADMLARLPAYSEDPLAWPAGPPCAQGQGCGSGSSDATGGGGAGGTGATEGGSSLSSGAGGGEAGGGAGSDRPMMDGARCRWIRRGARGRLGRTSGGLLRMRWGARMRPWMGRRRVGTR
ncbi:hypothetical protein [Sorangium sp. So ce362]|uniref:hypothetical protein n=1 Tax=Sorangium sp. So ce362 TaxID=3133303 RepID=UPI003F632E76